jgi:hypothetical protein
MGRYLESRRFGGLLRGASSSTPVSRQQGLTPEPRAYKHARYTADIEIAARRALATKPIAWSIWWYHFIHGCDAPDSVRLIERYVGYRVNRGNYFHRLYELEVMMGRVFLEVRPYGLFPQEYFAPSTRTAHA